MASRTTQWLVLSSVALAGLMTAQAPARADAVLTMNVVMPRASSFFVGVYKPWADAVEKESNGHIKVLGIPRRDAAAVAAAMGDGDQRCRRCRADAERLHS